MSEDEEAKGRVRRAIFARCRDLGLDDDERRAVGERATGKASLTGMSVDEMRKTLTALGDHGRPELPDGPLTPKLRALWISAYWLDVVRQADDRALAAWICMMTGVDSAKWAIPSQMARCIEALRSWMDREASVDWAPYSRVDRAPRYVPAARVLEALWRRCYVRGVVRVSSLSALQQWVCKVRKNRTEYTDLPDAVINELIKNLGRRLKRAGDNHDIRKEPDNDAISRD